MIGKHLILGVMCNRRIAAGCGVAHPRRERTARVPEPLAIQEGPSGYLEDPEAQVCRRKTHLCCHAFVGP